MNEPLVAKALAALREEDFVAARDFMADFGRLNSLEFQHYLIRGLAETALKDWPSARETFLAAAKSYPDKSQLWFNLGIAQENLGQLAEAATSFEHSLAMQPNDPNTCGNLSNVYCRLARFDEAEKMARRALELGAPRAQALNSLALALDRQNKIAEAGAAFEEALKLEPENAQLLCNHANFAADRFDFARAWPRFAAARRAGNDDAIIRHHEGMARLLAGDYAAGWPLYEARIEVKGGLRVKPPCPRYANEKLQGKTIMLVAEQGFGDVIQFCRYGAQLKEQGAELIWIVPKNLQRLLAANLPGCVLHEKEPLPPADYFLPILSLPLALGMANPAEAPQGPYLQPPAAGPALPHTAAKRKIGLVWAGAPMHEHDAERSIDPKLFAPLFKNPQFQFYAPFLGKRLDQAAGLPITRLDRLIGDFADTAALLKQLDALISVDTAVAHLAGALGVKSFLLLRSPPDWRWGTKGETTPWYEDFTLLRQPQPGDWQQPLARLAEML
jgi:Flp pilus assembly protein TadD